MEKFIDPAKQMVEEYLKDKKGDGNVVRQSIEENDKSVFSRVLNLTVAVEAAQRRLQPLFAGV